MKVQKESLDFLKYYVDSCDNYSQIGGLVKIIVNENEAVFMQSTLEKTLITTLECESDESFEILTDTKKLKSLIDKIDEDEIRITKTGIEFRDSNKYALTSYNYTFPNLSKLYESMEDKSSKDSFTITNSKDLHKLTKFVGKPDEALNYNIFSNGHILSTDKEIIAYTDFDIQDKKYEISDKVSNLLYKLGGEIELTFTDAIYYFAFGNTTCIVNRPKNVPQALFSVFTDNKFKDYFNRDRFISIDKTTFKDVVERMLLFVDPSFNKIHLTFTKDNLIVENKDMNECFEKIEVDCEIEAEITVNCKSLLNILNAVESKELDLYYIEINGSKVIRIEDKDTTFKFIVNRATKEG